MRNANISSRIVLVQIQSLSTGSNSKYVRYILYIPDEELPNNPHADLERVLPPERCLTELCCCLLLLGPGATGLSANFLSWLKVHRRSGASTAMREPRSHAAGKTWSIRGNGQTCCWWLCASLRPWGRNSNSSVVKCSAAILKTPPCLTLYSQHYFL